MSYSPPSSSLLESGWPTLGSLIDSGTRLITFMDSNADFTSVPYIIDGVLQLSSRRFCLILLPSEFTNIWETAYDVTTSFDCSVNRSNANTPTATSMYLINHFLDTVILGQPAPDPSQANQTNAVTGTNSLGEQFNLCVGQQGRNPNFMLVDVRAFNYLINFFLIVPSSTSTVVDLYSKSLLPLMASPIHLPRPLRLREGQAQHPHRA